LMIMMYVLSCSGVTAAAFAEETAWDTLIDGISDYQMDQKLKDKFLALCSENETALVDGRVETGGGLYMIMDVPVYKEPNRSKMTELKDKTIVVLTGQASTVDNKEWANIKFLLISSNKEYYEDKAVSIESGWIEKSHLKSQAKSGPKEKIQITEGSNE